MAQEMPWFMEYQKEPTYKGQVKEIKEYYPVMREEPELQDTDYHFYTYSIDRKLSSEYINNVDRLATVNTIGTTAWIPYYVTEIVTM